MNKLVGFFGIWVAYSVVLLLASAVFGDNVVLGNDKISGPMAAVVSALILNVAGYGVMPAVERIGLKRNLKLPKVGEQQFWTVTYLVANFIFVWVIKRFAQVTGFGVSNLLYVLILAIVLTVVGWGVAKATGMMAKTK